LIHCRGWMALAVRAEADDVHGPQIPAPKQWIRGTRGFSGKFHGKALLVINISFAQSIFMIASRGRERIFHIAAQNAMYPAVHQFTKPSLTIYASGNWHHISFWMLLD
jgi:hypothetical protein